MLGTEFLLHVRGLPLAAGNVKPRYAGKVIDSRRASPWGTACDVTRRRRNAVCCRRRSIWVRLAPQNRKYVSVLKNQNTNEEKPEIDLYLEK
ncbi:hypothetical protein EYF80_023446 [Liparis tanakae]|uniref:Uncharacterized protein n=1 Tax=Liparis tanakae TaxID=230148 RepID=A0A4Z2HL87_9TELE|nr:hypothetical protein EYF80_023446 [Liparis tanakae]